MIANPSTPLMAGLQPYPEYRPAGRRWLDSIPKDWEMIPNRALMQERRAVVGDNAKDHTLLSLTLRGVIARDMVNPKGKFPAQLNTYKVVEPGDFVFCRFDIDETPRGVGLSPLKGMITGAYDVFRPRQIIHPRFLYYYYLFVDDGKLMKPFYTGLRKAIQRGVFASLKAPCPPPSEQAAMVRFLDYANGRLERAIRAKRKVIALLHEQKQAIIHRAVTRGLNAAAAFKPSGIPWLGDIPEHWQIIPARHLFRAVTRRDIRGDEPKMSVTQKHGLRSYARGATKAGQHSAFSIICDGPATVRNVTFEDIRVEENITRMFELNVTDGKFYSQAPPGRIQGVRLKNVTWEKACPILITGHSAEHLVEDVVFEGCRVAGVPLAMSHIQTNSFTRAIVVR